MDPFLPEFTEPTFRRRPWRVTLDAVPLSVITGTFRVLGAAPDGDSIRFHADDPNVWSDAGIVVRANAQGDVQLRLDAIDALETHYTPPHAPHQLHQPPTFGHAAADRLLELLGFGGVTRDAREIVTAATPAETRGYLLTRTADVYGRAVALVYAGDRAAPADPDGTAYVDVPELLASVNAQLLAEGLVYPTFYSQLYWDFREALAASAVAARESRLGVWSVDATLPGFELTSAAQLTDDLVILPKLFRRLTEFLVDAADPVSLAGFTAFLAAHDDDELYTVPRGQYTTLDTLVEVTGHRVRLTVPPEQIVFIEA